MLFQFVLLIIAICALLSNADNPAIGPINKIYRSFRTPEKDHFFTISFKEHLKVTVDTQGKTVDEGYLGFIAPTKACDCLVELFRYYSMSAQDHHYSCNSAEIADLGKVGYGFESSLGFVAKEKGCGNATLAVHRFYSATMSDHQFVVDTEEVLDYMNKDSEYNDEGVPFYIWPQRDSKIVCDGGDTSIQVQ